MDDNLAHVLMLGIVTLCVTSIFVAAMYFEYKTKRDKNDT